MASHSLRLLLALLAPNLIFAQSVNLHATRDNTLFDDPSGALSSGAGPYLFCGNNGNSNTRRTAIAFDLASHIDAGSTIDSVTLRLFVSSAPDDIPQHVALHALLAGWGEGTSVAIGGAGAASTTDDVTWLHSFYPNQFWSNAGGDFVEAASAVAMVGTSGPHLWSSAAMVADVQRWLDTPEQNFGWLLKGTESSASTVRRFDSHENDTLANRPTLIIHYTTNATAIAPTSWGVVKKRYLQPHEEQP